MRRSRGYPQAVCRADGRHRDGRRRRRRRARQRPRRHRHHEDGDARGGYRVHPRRRRHVHPVAGARPARPARRADGRTVRAAPTRSPWASPTTTCRTTSSATSRDAIVADGIDAALAAYATEPPPSELLAQRHWIDECYAGETVADIVAALRGHDAGPANDAANLIMTRSPDLAVGRAGGGAPRRQARHPRRRAAPGVSDVVRVAAVHTTSSRASAPRSSTRTATRSGRPRRWPRSPPPTSTPTSRPPTPI